MSSPAFCIYTSLFTLADKDPAQNSYIWIYLTWLWSLITFGGLDFKKDRVVILIDSDTYAVLKTIKLHSDLIENLERVITYYMYDRPSTLLEGFFNRHTPQFIEHLTQHPLSDHTIFLHMDTDTIFQKPLRSLPWPSTIAPNMVFCYLEGVTIYSKCHLQPFLDHCSRTDELTYFSENLADYFTNAPGFTAGMFGFTAGSEIKAMFNEIDVLKLTTLSSSKYYEQGCINYVMTKYHIIGKITLDFSPLSLQSVVGRNEDNGEAMITLFGEAGDGNFHLDKVLGYLFTRASNITSV